MIDEQEAALAAAQEIEEATRLRHTAEVGKWKAKADAAAARQQARCS